MQSRTKAAQDIKEAGKPAICFREGEPRTLSKIVFFHTQAALGLPSGREGYTYSQKGGSQACLVYGDNKEKKCRYLFGEGARGLSSKCQRLREKSQGKDRNALGRAQLLPQSFS